MHARVLLWPESAANFMNALFHGLDFRKLQAGERLFSFGDFAYGLAVLTGWAFVLGSLFGWLQQLFAVPALADRPATKEKMVVEAKVVALKDGGRITVDKAGRTYHVDSTGKRVRMKDGVVMEAQDGTKYVHKNDPPWKRITEKGTRAPNR